MNKAKSKITPNTESWKSDKHLNMFSNQINILDFYLMHVLYPLKGIVNTVTKRNMYNFFRISESVSFFFFLLLFLPQNRGGGIIQTKEKLEISFFLFKKRAHFSENLHYLFNFLFFSSLSPLPLQFAYKCSTSLPHNCHLMPLNR